MVRSTINMRGENTNYTSLYSENTYYVPDNPPDRATISLTMKPLFEKFLISSLRLDDGGGRLETASFKLAVVESLLPNSTVQPSPRS